MAPIRAISSAAHGAHGFSRRRSSFSLHSSKRKSQAAHKNFTFAPNVTPVSYPADRTDGASDPMDPSSSNFSRISPADNDELLRSVLDRPNLTTPPSSSRPRRRRRDSSGNEHIPRPPNAFMLYRQDFVHQRHIPGSIDSNPNNSLSRIVGDHWKRLPATEKKKWEELAERKKAEHKKRYPDYRFQPKHDPEKKRRRAEARAAAAAQLITHVHKSSPADGSNVHPHMLQLGNIGKKGKEGGMAVAEPRAHKAIPGAPGVGGMHMGMNMAGMGMNANSQPFHIGHRRSSSVPLPQEAFAYQQAHNMYPYGPSSNMGFGFDLQQLQHQHQQQQQTSQMDEWSVQNQQPLPNGFPPHSAAPHPGYAHVPLAHSLFPGTAGAATNPFNFADPAVAGLRRNGAPIAAPNENANTVDEQQTQQQGIAIPTVPRLTGLTPSNAHDEGNNTTMPANEQVQETPRPDATPMLHQPAPYRLSLNSASLFMPQPHSAAGVTATSLSASGNSSCPSASRGFPSFLGKMPSFSIPLSFDMTHANGGEAAENGEFIPPQQFYINMGAMAVDPGAPFDGFSYGASAVTQQVDFNANARSLQQAALHQRQLANLGRRASSTQPILEQQRAYVLGQLGESNGPPTFDFPAGNFEMGPMGMFGGPSATGGVDQQQQQQQHQHQQPFADYYADYQLSRGGEEEMRGFRNPFAAPAASAGASSQGDSNNAAGHVPSSSCSETTTDSAGPASPDASGDVGTSPMGGKVETLEEVPPHQQVTPVGQEHGAGAGAVARGLELAEGAYPFVGHGEEAGAIMGMGANGTDVSMERNSFDFTAMRRSLFPSSSVGPPESSSAAENVAPHERVHSGYNALAYSQSQMRPPPPPQKQQTQFGYNGGGAAVAPMTASPHMTSYGQQPHQHQQQPQVKRVVSAPVYHGQVNGMEMLDSGYTPAAAVVGTEGAPASASGSPATVGAAAPLPAVAGDALGLYKQQHDQHAQFALQSYYTGLGDARLAGEVDEEALGADAVRFSFSEFVHDSPRMELGRTPVS